MVRFPYRVEGWYWAPEAELVKDDPNAEFLESFVFDESDSTDRPLAFLLDYYRRRKLLDSTGDIAGYGYKILINAMYGQLAQRAGWDKRKRTAPKSHQLEWAGYITSACRAAVTKVAWQCGDKLISINTDSVMALCPLEEFCDTGLELGQWKTTHYLGGLFWQAGIYTLQEDMGYDAILDYGWSKAKSRGIPRGQYTSDQLRDCIRNRRPLTLVRKMFITYSLAIMGDWEKRNTWNEEPSEYKLGGSDGKRIHFFRGRAAALPRRKWYKCHPICRELPEHMHRTIPNLMGEMLSLDGDLERIESVPHWLPWLDKPSEIKSTIDGYMVEMNELDPEDDWNMEEIERATI